MKNKIFIIAILFCFSSLFSQTYYLNIHFKDGTKIQYVIDDIQKIDFSDVTGIEDFNKLKQLVKSFQLFQNYPNPFNPSTTIEYFIPKSGKVEIMVFDMNGRLIKKLLNQIQNQGRHKINWNGTNNNGAKVSSGFYVYIIKYETKVLSKKMILIK